MQRRDVLKGAAIGVVAGTALAQDQPAGPYSLPTVRFDKNLQHVVPADAFKVDLVEYFPLVPRPTAIGTYEELATGDLRTKAFGPGDSTPIGECFHGVAREWVETPAHWERYGCCPQKTGAAAWDDKHKMLGKIPRHDSSEMMANWGAFKIKCYKFAVEEVYRQLPGLKHPTRFYSYGGRVPGPTLKIRLGQPAVVRFENHLETEISVHLHGGHNPSHSDGFPTFYVLQGKARDYFYPNMLPLYRDGTTYHVDVGESQSTMWYHDHAMDATAYNAAKGLSAFAPCFGEEELALISTGVLPGLGARSCIDPEQDGLKMVMQNGQTVPDPALEAPEWPGYYKHAEGCEPYYNPYDIPLVLQDRVFDPETGQIAYDNTGHNGYIGHTMVVNGIPYPFCSVERRKYRFRILNGSNARVFRLRIMSAEKFLAANQDGIDNIPINPKLSPTGPTPPLNPPDPNHVMRDENATQPIKERPDRYDAASEHYLQIGKDSWLWSHALQRKAVVLTMANRADIVVDFGMLTAGLNLAPGETREFYLVNTMPQADGRGPKQKLDDGGDPRVLAVPFDVAGVPGVDDLRLGEANRPTALVKFVVSGPPVTCDATVADGTPLIKTHRPIRDEEVRAVREFIFERGKGAWQINGRFYDPYIANAGPVLDGAEEWVFRNGGGGWWHPIHVHLESHYLVAYEKDFEADDIIAPGDPLGPNVLGNLQNLIAALPEAERIGLHDTTALGPNTVARIRIRHRTWNGPFVFHCHNLEHEDMRMMFNFEPVPEATKNDGGRNDDDLLPNVAPTARTHGNDVTWQGGKYVGELPWEYPPVPSTPVTDAGEELIPPRPKVQP